MGILALVCSDPFALKWGPGSGVVRRGGVLRYSPSEVILNELFRIELLNISRQPVQHFVIRSRQRKRPGVSASQANGRAGKEIFENGLSSASPQITPASFAPIQVAAATPCPANPMAKYMSSIFPECGITSKCKIQRAAPHELHFCVRKLRIDFDHSCARRSSALSRTVHSDSGKKAARPPKSMRLSGVSR